MVVITTRDKGSLMASRLTFDRYGNIINNENCSRQVLLEILLIKNIIIYR